MSCTWPVDRTCLPDPGDAVEDIARMQEAIDTAVSVLWSLTGRRFAVCPVKTRPCPTPFDTSDVGDVGIPQVGFTPVLFGGRWQNEYCGAGCGFGFDNPAVVTLPGAVEVIAVEVDGVVIAPDSYALEGDRLIRRVGQWPSQALHRPLGEPGTWAVEYLRGTPPPAGAALAVGQLAQEFWNICSGGKCRLPKRTQSISRQGVTITRADPTDIIAQGYTGLPEIDLWISAQNPNKLMQPAAIISPDYLGGA